MLIQLRNRIVKGQQYGLLREGFGIPHPRNQSEARIPRYPFRFRNASAPQTVPQKQTGQAQSRVEVDLRGGTSTPAISSQFLLVVLRQPILSTAPRKKLTAARARSTRKLIFLIEGIEQRPFVSAKIGRKSKIPGKLGIVPQPVWRAISTTDYLQTRKIRIRPQLRMLA